MIKRVQNKESLEWIEFETKDNCFIPSVFNIGISDVKDCKNSHPLISKFFKIWIGKIHKCYNPKNKDFKRYGAKGVYMSKEWHIFSNFLKWCLENYVKDYHLDKDKLSPIDNVHYSKETCCFISVYENCVLLTSKNTKDYETQSVERNDFKRHCVSKGMDFNDFIEIKVERSKGSGKKAKYNYFLKNKNLV